MAVDGGGSPMAAAPCSSGNSSCAGGSNPAAAAPPPPLPPPFDQTMGLRLSGISETMVAPHQGTTTAAASGTEAIIGGRREQQQQSAAGGEQSAGATDEDNFPEDLNGLEGIADPMANPALLLDAKVEPFFGFPLSANGHYVPQHATLPLQQPFSAPAGQSSFVDSEGGGQQQHNCRLVIRDPFACDELPFSCQPSPSGLDSHNQQQTFSPQLAPLSWDGKPPDDEKYLGRAAKSLAELSRDPNRPMVPLPKEGGMPVPFALPHFSFLDGHYIPVQRHRLEQLYPGGTFSPAFFSRWSPMPMPRPPGMMGPTMPGRLVLIPLRSVVLPPLLLARLPPSTGMLPAMILPTGQLMPLYPTPAGLVPLHILCGPPPPAQMMPGPGLAGGQPPSSAGGHQQQGGGGKQSAAGGQQQPGGPKPKKESAKQRKQREKEEQQRREQEQQQAAMAMGRQSAEPGMPPPFFAAFGPPPPGAQMGQMPMPPMGMAMGIGQPQQQQQDNMFKVPGRSPPLKRCSSSLPPPPQSVMPPQPPSAPLPSAGPMGAVGTLNPMPDQRIHASGQCVQCQAEINCHQKGIQCTAISQGCNRLHCQNCAGLTPEAFAQFCQDSRLEWICQNCFLLRDKEHCLVYAV